MRVLLVLLLLAAPALAEEPKRDAKVVREWRKTHPCPSTGKTTGACKGWVADHIRPLCFGGADSPSNLAWQEVKESYKKDAFEREACAMKKRLAAMKTCKP